MPSDHHLGLPQRRHVLALHDAFPWPRWGAPLGTFADPAALGHFGGSLYEAPTCQLGVNFLPKPTPGRFRRSFSVPESHLPLVAQASLTCLKCGKSIQMDQQREPRVPRARAPRGTRAKRLLVQAVALRWRTPARWMFSPQPGS